MYAILFHVGLCFDNLNIIKKLPQNVLPFLNRFALFKLGCVSDQNSINKRVKNKRINKYSVIQNMKELIKLICSI